MSLIYYVRNFPGGIVYCTLGKSLVVWRCLKLEVMYWPKGLGKNKGFPFIPS